MLLAIDVGNTNTCFALFAGKQLQAQWRMRTDSHRTADEYAAALFLLMEKGGYAPQQVEAAIVSSVVPDTNFNLQSYCRQYLGCTALIVGHDPLDIGIAVDMPNPQEVGADRLVNAAAAKAKFGAPLIIVDFGTATTFDVVDANGSYVGGVIAPGVNLSLDALQKAAAKLPGIAIRQPASVIGHDTISAMQSGIYFGYVGLIEGVVNRIHAQLGVEATVIATGGLASLYARETKLISHIEPDLTMLGLQAIYEKNKKAT